MTSGLSYEWHEARPRRWRRWLARLCALLALAATGTGLWMIVRDAVVDAPPPATLGRELQALAGSAEAVAVRLVALRPGDRPRKARAAVREVRADLGVAVAELRRRRASGPVRADGLLGAALAAGEAYFETVDRVLRHPRSRAVADLRERSRRARAAFAALPEPAGLPEAVRGWQRLAAYARAARG